MPFISIDTILKAAETAFVKRWSTTGGFEGWHDKPAEADLAKTDETENNDSTLPG